MIKTRDLPWRSLAQLVGLGVVAVAANAASGDKVQTDASAKPIAARGGDPGTATWLALPGSGEAWTDYVAFEPSQHSLWIPAGNRGAVYVLDTRTQQFRTIGGLATKATDRGRLLGPSSASPGMGQVFVGNRADNSVCQMDATTLATQGCVTLPTMPDGLTYVAATREVWATTPRDQSLTVLRTGPAGLALAGSIKLDGQPEGYAVDSERGVFYTNFEDKDRTVAVDLKSRAVVSTFEPSCGKSGPRGLALDLAHRQLFVGCYDGGAVALDLAHNGKVIGRVSSGAGVDNIDFQPARRRLFLASGTSGTVTIASVEPSGAMSVERTVPSAQSGRTVVLDSVGRAYVPDSKGGRVLVIGAAP